MSDLRLFVGGCRDGDWIEVVWEFGPMDVAARTPATPKGWAYHRETYYPFEIQVGGEVYTVMRHESVPEEAVVPKLIENYRPLKNE